MPSPQTDLVAKASTTIDAPTEIVWDALVTPSIIREYMFGTNVESDFQEGSPIVWKGEWQGKAYEDKGIIKKVQRHRLLQFTHATGGSEEVHTVTIELAEKGSATEVTLSQDNNANEEAREQSTKNWQMMLDGLKKLLEQ